jgi:hypothetical protein
MGLKDNPLDRIRTDSSRSIESADDCFSLVVYGKGGVEVVLPYSYLRGAIAQYQRCILLHSLAVVTISGHQEAIREITQLLSRHRLALIRHGIENLTVDIKTQEDMDSH